MRRIIGISAYYHDSAASLIIDGEIISAAQEERFTRKKHDPSFPENAIKYCLTKNNLSLKDIDAVVYYEKPLLTFERLLETYLAISPRGLRSFMAAMQVWLKEKLFLKYEIKNNLVKLQKKINGQLISKKDLPQLLFRSIIYRMPHQLFIQVLLKMQPFCAWMGWANGPLLLHG